MTLGDILSIGGLVVFVALILLGFRQGLKVKPSGDGPKIGPESGTGHIDGSGLP